MERIKVLTVVILSIFIFLCFLFAINIFGYRSKISGNKIKEIRLGMPLEQVISTLGKPYEIEDFGGNHNSNCENPNLLKIRVNNNTDIIHIVDSFYNVAPCCDSYEESVRRLRGKQVTLTYTKKPAPLIIGCLVSHPMLWVHLDSNYCVRSVYAKRYEGNDICIYSLSWQYDEETLKDKTGEVIFFINDELFNKSFRK
jgi:hypothetical protein